MGGIVKFKQYISDCSEAFESAWQELKDSNVELDPKIKDKARVFFSEGIVWIGDYQKSKKGCKICKSFKTTYDCNTKLNLCDRCLDLIDKIIEDRRKEAICMKHNILPVKHRKINKDVSITIGKEIGLDKTLSNHMGMVIEDKKHNVSIALKLSTFRKIFKVLVKWDWFKPRKMNKMEKNIVYLTGSTHETFCR